MTEFQTLGDWQDDGPEATGIILTDPIGRVALQLRDDFDHVQGPGHWGFFGGQREPGETMAQAAIREMAEETDLRFTEDEIAPFARTKVGLGARIYMFTTPRTMTPEQITLREGAGFAFLTPAQIAEAKCLASTALILDHYFAQKR